MSDASYCRVDYVSLQQPGALKKLSTRELLKHIGMLTTHMYSWGEDGKPSQANSFDSQVIEAFQELTTRSDLHPLEAFRLSWEVYKARREDVEGCLIDRTDTLQILGKTFYEDRPLYDG